MPIVTYPDGTKVNFSRTPSQEDMDLMYQKIQQKKSQATAPVPEKGKFGSFIEGVGNFTGGTKLGQGISQTIMSGSVSKQIEDTQAQQFDLQNRLISKIKENDAAGKDSTRLKSALESLTADINKFGGGAEDMLNPNKLTTKQVVGDALQTAATVASAGTYGAAAKAGSAVPSAIGNVIPKGPGFFAGLGKGAAKGAAEGAAFGAAQGAASELQSDGSAGEIVQSALGGAAFGALGGGIVGGVVGGSGAAMQGRELNKKIVAAQEASGIRPTLSKTVAEKTKSAPEFKKVVDEAKKQGFDEREINFLATISDADKPIMKQMFDVTARAKTDPRQIQRAADILGENATNIVRQVEKQNRDFGKAVDATAKALKGQVVDATAVRERALALLEDVGVTSNADGTPNWSNSIFSKTPELQASLIRNLSDLPVGQMDAYDLHKFKKSIDNVVEYGVGGEGYKGDAATILKKIRREADAVLDANFEDYNLANTEFKNTRDFLDEVRDVVGTKVDFSSKASSQAFGQAFRSAFSNNKSRGKTLQLIENLQNVAKSRSLSGAEQNLLDQALYVNMLEDTFGSQAATGLASEVRKGVEAAKSFRQALKGDPLAAVASAGAEIYERTRGITPEMKQDILQKFLSK